MHFSLQTGSPLTLVDEGVGSPTLVEYIWKKKNKWSLALAWQFRDWVTKSSLGKQQTDEVLLVEASAFVAELFELRRAEGRGGGTYLVLECPKVKGLKKKPPVNALRIEWV